jgi:flavin-dependent dehydrogenase
VTNDASATEVVVIGGGPGGSVCAAQLARRGVSVVVLEKETFPRFHLGESLLPQSLPVLEEIGVLDQVSERFIHKFGARFHDDIRGRTDRFSFESAWNADVVHAFQVPRDSFDELLLEHAVTCGADVRQRWTAERLITNESGRAIGVEATLPDGSSKRIDARFVVDASGRDIFTARAASAATKIEGLDQTALYAHFEGVPRESGKLEGDVDIVLFATTATERPNWFWFIPFKDGRTSVGAVVSRAWMRDRRAGLAADADIATSLFRIAISESKTATSLLANAKWLWPRAEATADFSYRVRTMTGDGWLAIGDASGFIDPLFSTGVHIALHGAKLAADAIAGALESPAEERRLLEAWETNLRAGAETFILAVESFYRGPLVDYLFVADKRAALRRSITSLLAGDVFGDAVWLRDTRLRLKEMLASPPRIESIETTGSRRAL